MCPITLVNEINSKTAAEVTDRDIEILIAYHRNNRARRAAGFKTAKPERPKIDVLGMLGIEARPAPVRTVTPVGSSGVRRL